MAFLVVAQLQLTERTPNVSLSAILPVENDHPPQHLNRLLVATQFQITEGFQLEVV